MQTITDLIFGLIDSGLEFGISPKKKTAQRATSKKKMSDNKGRKEVAKEKWESK